MPKIKKRADGRLVKTLTDENGKRIFFYGKTEREINKKILSYHSREEQGSLFAEISDAWWDEAEPALAFQSVRTYRQAKRRADAYFGEKPIRTILPKDVIRFLAKVAEQGYAQKTVTNQRMVLSLIFSYAVKENAVSINPCASVRIPKNLSKTKRTSASLDDENIIRTSADVWLFPFFALMTGMRKGEILALTWGDIDFENNTIHVTKSVYHEGDRALIKEPKTKSGTRTVPLLAPLKEKLLQIENRSSSLYIFSDTGEAPLSNRRFLTLTKHFKEATGTTATAHQLRHSFATFAFECGIPAKSIQEILGHSQVSTTLDIYTDFRQAAFDGVVEILNGKMKK